MMVTTMEKERKKMVCSSSKADETERSKKKKTARPRWWKDLPEEKCDPITLEPFCEQAPWRAVELLEEEV